MSEEKKQQPQQPPKPKPNQDRRGSEPMTGKNTMPKLQNPPAPPPPKKSS